MLTPKVTGGHGNTVFTEPIPYSALLESGYSSTGAVATNCTIALGFKPSAATTSPLCDMTGHYLMTIQKQDTTVRLWKQGVELAAYTGAIGSTYAEFLSNVLTAYAGSDKGYYSRLIVAEAVLTYSDFWKNSDYVTGLWVPKSIKELTLHTLLDFSDAAVFGIDSSGNGNNWTLAGSPVQTSDTPTNNYATANPHQGFHPNTGYADGNLTIDFTGGSPSAGTGISTIPMPTSGKYYVEMKRLGSAETYPAYAGFKLLNGDGTQYVQYAINGEVKASNGPYNAVHTGIGQNNVVSFAMDIDAGTVEIRHDDVVQATVNYPVAETLFVRAMSYTTGNNLQLNFGSMGFTHTPPSGFKSLCSANFPNPLIMKSSTVADLVLREGTYSDVLVGGTAYAGNAVELDQIFDNVTTESPAQGQLLGPPTNNYAAYQLPTPQTITSYRIMTRGDDYPSRCPTAWRVEGSNDGSLSTESGHTSWSNYVWKNFTVDTPGEYLHYRWYITANGGASYTLIAEIDAFIDPEPIVLPDMEGGPDFVTAKNRDSAGSWSTVDSLRGDENVIHFDKTLAEYAWPGSISLTTDGYDLGATSVNTGGDSFMDICLKAGVEQGFEIVTWTGDGVAGRTIEHNLGKAPTFITVKCVSSPDSWAIYHAALGATKNLQFTTDAAQIQTNKWNDTEPTGTHFTLGASSKVNANGETYVAYLFTDSDIFKAFSYTGNMSTNGPFVDLEGRPSAILFLKNADGVFSWLNSGGAREPVNPINQYLVVDTTSAEVTAPYDIFQFTSTGIKVVTDISTAVNGSGDLHVGLAVLESTNHSNAY